MGTHREYKSQITRIISIPIIVLFIVNLSLDIKEVVEHIWDYSSWFQPHFCVSYEWMSIFVYWA